LVGPFQIHFNGINVSSCISRESLQGFTLRAEGSYLWDFMADSLNLEARKEIFSLMGFALGDHQAFKKVRVELFLYDARHFAGWVRSGSYDKNTRLLSLSVDSAGMVLKDLPAGEVSEGETPSTAFSSDWSEVTYSGSRRIERLYSTMSPLLALQTLTASRSAWLAQKGFEGFDLQDPSVSIRDFAENYTVGNGEELDAGDYEVLSIRYETFSAGFYLILRINEGGYWGYYRQHIGTAGLGSREFLGNLHGVALPEYLITADPSSSPFQVYHGAVLIGNYESTVGYYPGVLPPAVREYLSERFDIDENNFLSRVPIGLVWYVVGINESGDRTFVQAEVIQQDEYRFAYNAEDRTGQFLRDLAIMTDGLVGFDYSKETGPRITLTNREAGPVVRSSGVLSLRRYFTEASEQGFTAPGVFELLDAVRAGIEAFYLDRLNRESEDFEVEVLRSKLDDPGAVRPGARLVDAEEGDLGQIIAVTPGAYAFRIITRKRARQ